MELGVIGAGRLGSAVIRAWSSTNGRAKIWSRGGSRELGLPADALRLVAWVEHVEDLFDSDHVFGAISGRALRQITSNSSRIKNFSGVFFCAAPEVDSVQLSALFPVAECVRVCPSLLNSSLSVLVLAVPAMRKEGLAALRRIGEVDITDDQKIFENLSLLGSPFPVVLARSLKGFLANIFEEENQEISRKILFRGIRSLLESESIDNEWLVATPGGITEQGLKKSSEVEKAFMTIFNELKEAVDKRRQ